MSTDGANRSPFSAEVVGRILGFFIREEDEGNWTVIAARRKTASHVSTTWRNIVYSTSIYWRYLPLHLYINPKFVAFVLDRAKAGPIFLHISVARWMWQHPTSYTLFRRERCMTLSRFLTTTLPLLRTAYSRVVSISVDADSDSDAVAVMACLRQYGGSSIRRITVLSHSASPPATAFSTGVQRLPSLSRMILRNTRPAALGLSVFRSLQSLCLSTVSEDAQVSQALLIDVLRNCEALRELALNDVVCVGIFNGPPVAIPSVRRFRIDYTEYRCVEVLHWVLMPCLQDLCVVSLDEDAYIHEIVNEAPHLFADAVHIDIRCPAASIFRLGYTIPKMCNARTLDLRGSVLFADMLSLSPDLSRAFQTTKLNTIRLPAHMPLNVFQLLLDFFNNANSNMKIQVEAGPRDGCLGARWAVLDNALVCRPLELEEGPGWMTDFDADPLCFRV